MNYLFIFSLFFFALYSCERSGEQKKVSIGYEGADSLRTIISLKEKNLKLYYKQLVEGTVTVDSLPDKMINELVKEYQVFYQSYPKDTISPYYIDKIHQLFTQEKQYSYAVDWVDTLLYHYPNYKNKALVLYSAATSSDLFLMDTNRVKKYYNRMLNECPKLKKDVKDQIQHRLRFLKYPSLEYLKKRDLLK
jgi:hypothetical protein